MEGPESRNSDNYEVGQVGGRIEMQKTVDRGFVMGHHGGWLRDVHTDSRGLLLPRLLGLN